MTFKKFINTTNIPNHAYVKTILFTGSARQGIKTLTDIFAHIPLSLGMNVSSSQFYQSSPGRGAIEGDVVLGGDCQNYYVDFLVALNQEGLMYSQSRINDKTILVYDSKEVDTKKLQKKPKKEIGIDFQKISQSSYTNTSAMGVMFKLLGVESKDKSLLENLIKKKFRGGPSEIIRGFDTLDYSLSDILNFDNKKSFDTQDLHYLMGNESAVYGALAAGSNFFAGYPITPSSETMHMYSQVNGLIDNSGFLQGSSEEHAIGVVLGANAAGGKGWTATSGPGLDRMLEQIGWGIASKTPFVVYNVQRGGPSTGLATLTQTSDLFTAVHGGHGDYPIFVLTPSTAQETYGLMKLAFKLAWSYNIGVIVNSSKDVAQRRGIVKLDMQGFDHAEFDLNKLVKGNRTGSASGKDEIPKNEEAVEWLNNRFERFEKDYDKLCIADFVNIDVEDKKGPYKYRDLSYSEFKNVKFESINIKSAPEEVYICYGETVPVIRKHLGKKGLIALKSVHPYPISLVKQLNKLGVKKVYVAENNRGVLVHEESGQLANKIRQYFDKEVVTLNKWDGFPMYPDKLKEYFKKC